MDFRVLGPLEVSDGGRAVVLGGVKQRSLLAILLQHPNAIVSTDHLLAELWGEAPPASADNSIHVHVSRLRKELGPDRLITRAPGYVLRVDASELDLTKFKRLRDEGRPHEALALWRGPAYDDLAYERCVQAERARLDELRLVTLEERIDDDLANGRHADLIGELEALTAEHPLRERLRGQLMLALYRCGRQAEALEAYRRARAELVDELGIEPGRPLRDLHDAILRQDAALDGRPARRPVAPDQHPGVFVGRAAELADLTDGLEQAFAGRGRLSLLTGEPGIGKSRLAEELLARARRRGARTLVGRCWEAGGAPAYWPWVQSLRSYLDDRDSAGLPAELGAGAHDLARLLPELGTLMPGPPQPPANDPDAARFRLFDAVATFLRRAAEAQPIVLVLDDLHAADESSLLLLRFVARGLARTRLLILGAYRDVDPVLQDPLASTLVELRREGATWITLGGLAEAEVGEYMALTAGVVPAPATVATIHARTEGNVLFVDEITRLLSSEGALAGSGPVEVGLPPGVRDVIGRRFRRLSEDCRGTLTTASVLGGEVALDALARMTGDSPAQLLDVLDEALEARLLDEAPGAPARLRFSHALVRDTLYNGLTPSRRARLHGVAGEALEALYAGNPEPHLSELAHHFASAVPAVEPGRAIAYA